MRCILRWRHQWGANEQMASIINHTAAQYRAFDCRMVCLALRSDRILSAWPITLSRWIPFSLSFVQTSFQRVNVSVFFILNRIDEWFSIRWGDIFWNYINIFENVDSEKNLIPQLKEKFLLKSPKKTHILFFHLQ